MYNVYPYIIYYKDLEKALPRLERFLKVLVNDFWALVTFTCQTAPNNDKQEDNIYRQSQCRLILGIECSCSASGAFHDGPFYLSIQ